MRRGARSFAVVSAAERLEERQLLAATGDGQTEDDEDAVAESISFRTDATDGEERFGTERYGEELDSDYAGDDRPLDDEESGSPFRWDEYWSDDSRFEEESSYGEDYADGYDGEEHHAKDY